MIGQGLSQLGSVDIYDVKDPVKSVTDPGYIKLYSYVKVEYYK